LPLLKFQHSYFPGPSILQHAIYIAPSTKS